jgi:hypothetical protein
MICFDNHFVISVMSLFFVSKVIADSEWRDKLQIELIITEMWMLKYFFMLTDLIKR